MVKIRVRLPLPAQTKQSHRIGFVSFERGSPRQQARAARSSLLLARLPPSARLAKGGPLNPKMFFTYILISLKDKRTYAGYTPDISARLKKHNAGQVKATKHRRPLELIYLEEFKTAKEAKKRELFWKSGAGRRKMKELFNSREGLDL